MAIFRVAETERNLAANLAINSVFAFSSSRLGPLATEKGRKKIRTREKLLTTIAENFHQHINEKRPFLVSSSSSLPTITSRRENSDYFPIRKNNSFLPMDFQLDDYRRWEEVELYCGKEL